MNDPIEEIRDIRRWVAPGDMSREQIEVQLDWIIETGLAIIDRLQADDIPEQTLSPFILLNTFLAAAAAQKPSLVKKLFAQVQKFISSARSPGTKLKADSESVSSGFPWGVSVDLS